MFNIHVPFAFATNTIQKDPGVIVGPIVGLLGIVINFFYDVAFLLMGNHALGISIIMVTIVARSIMLPFGIQQQKSMTAMQKLQPEINKIKEKYGDTKDPELMRKMQAEQQALYSKHKVNPLAGCIPMLLTLPIFFALNTLFRRTYLYISKIGDIYNNLSTTIISMPDYTEFCKNVLKPLGQAKVPKGMTVDLLSSTDLTKLIHNFSMKDWEAFKNALSPSVWANIEPFYNAKMAVESFMGINLVEFSGLAFPGVIIPVLTAATTLLSSWIMMKTSSSMDEKQKQQQYVMMIAMPIMMFMFTINMPSAVGLYWIISSIYQSAQQYFLSRYYAGKIVIERTK